MGRIAKTGKRLGDPSTWGRGFTPRHLRRGAVNKSGPGKQEKSRMFRHAKRYSDRFIHQSASMLANPRLANDYAEYCHTVDTKGYLRKTK